MKMKWEIRTIVKVQVTRDFHLICTFDNGVMKDYDMTFIKKSKGPVIEPLKKPSFFKKVFLEMGVPTWPNGFDVCSDVIYQKAELLRPQKTAV